MEPESVRSPRPDFTSPPVAPTPVARARDRVTLLELVSRVLVLPSATVRRTAPEPAVRSWVLVPSQRRVPPLRVRVETPWSPAVLRRAWLEKASTPEVTVAVPRPKATALTGAVLKALVTSSVPPLATRLTVVPPVPSAAAICSPMKPARVRLPTPFFSKTKLRAAEAPDMCERRAPLKVVSTDWSTMMVRAPLVSLRMAP